MVTSVRQHLPFGGRPANLYVMMGRSMLPFRPALPFVSLTKMRAEHTENGSFLVLVFGLLVCVL